MHTGRRMRRIALISVVRGIGLSLLKMAAASLGFFSPIEGAMAQEITNLLSILNPSRMSVATGLITEFEAGPSLPARKSPKA